jgi:hypothetical protein
MAEDALELLPEARRRDRPADRPPALVGALPRSLDQDRLDMIEAEVADLVGCELAAEGLDDPARGALARLSGLEEGGAPIVTRDEVADASGDRARGDQQRLAAPRAE